MEGDGSDNIVVGKMVLRVLETNWRWEEGSRNDSGAVRSGSGDGGFLNDNGEIIHEDTGKSQNHFSDILEEM